MPRYLKTGISDAEAAEADEKVRRVVEDALNDIAKRGDAAVREMSIKFDSWEREDFRLSEAEIEACLDRLAGAGPRRTSSSPRSRFGTSRRRSATRCRTWRSRPCRAWCSATGTSR